MDLQQWWELFLAFFSSNILGYGGGPASIPLVYNEVVNHYHFVTQQQFTNMLALGNALPGPIATKLAANIGYETAGIPGVLIALFATVVPSVVALIIMLRFLLKHRQSPVVKGISLLVQPVIAMLMLILTLNMSSSAVVDIGWLQTLLIAAFAFIAMQQRQWHPAVVVLIAFAYGGIVLPMTMS